MGADGQEYHFQTPADMNGDIVIEDMTKFVEVCEFVNGKFTADSHLDLEEEIALFREYEKLDKKAVQLFMQLNNMQVSVEQIDLYLDQHYFEHTLIAHSLEDSNLAMLPEDVRTHIVDYLYIDDINNAIDLSLSGLAD